MSKMMENVQTVNSAIRTALAVVLVGGASYGGLTIFNTYNAKELNEKKLNETKERVVKLERDLESAADELKQKEAALADSAKKIVALNEDIVQKEAEIHKLDTSIRLLKVDHRLARMTVLDQKEDAEGNLVTDVEFVDVNDEGQPIDKPQTFRIKGDVIYVDALVASFGDEFVEAGDPLRGTALISFRRIFGEHQPPAEGFPLDPINKRPQAYAKGEQVSDFEKKIWGDFWKIANDKQLADKFGVKDANGRAPYIKAQKGKKYKLTLRSTGDLSIKPE